MTFKDSGGNEVSTIEQASIRLSPIRVPPKNLTITLKLILACLLPGMAQAAEPVALSLKSPWNGLRVIGDPMPLQWHFTNQSEAPLAFVWEGCCRQNGHLSIWLDGREIDPIPPTTALAHMFAKPEILQPNQSTSFETRISDWVVLTEGGDYRFQGHYTGVLPTQKPPLRIPVQLWKDKAASDTVDFPLLTSPEYLAMRPKLIEESGLRIHLDTQWVRPDYPNTKEAHKKPTNLDPIEFAIRIVNEGTEDISFDWPADFQLWHVDRNGQRVGGISTSLNSTFEKVLLKPGGALEKVATPELYPLEGKAFGPYQIFVDMPPTSERSARVPSNTIDYDWKFTSKDIHRLIGFSSGQPSRNPHLKLLRIHLLDIASRLKLLNAELYREEESGALLRELQQAAVLKPLLPEPGELIIPMALDKGSPILKPSKLKESLGALPFPTLQEQLTALVDLRRHLGWKLTIELDPSQGASEEVIQQAVADLSSISRYLTVRLRTPEGSVQAK